MSQPEITDKLNEHLNRHDPMTEECHVVYLMVETRKFLDRLGDKGEKELGLIRFYCNWTLHTSKYGDRKNMAPIMKRIYEDICAELKGGPKTTGRTPVVGFVAMEDLRTILARFFKAHHINPTLVEKDGSWRAFVLHMASILADQPLEKPTDEIAQLVFHPAGNGRIRGSILFAKEIEGANKKIHREYAFGAP
jgi:hypothetical protein